MLVGALLAGFAAALSLLLPWFRVGARSRSSIDLIGGLGALDVIEGPVKALVVIGWFAVPALVAAALIAGAAGRNRLAAALLLPLGPVLAGSVVAVIFVAGDVLRWGAYVAASFAIASSVSAIMVIRRAPA